MHGKEVEAGNTDKAAERPARKRRGARRRWTGGLAGLLVVVGLGLAACGGGSSKAGTSSTTAAAGSSGDSGSSGGSTSQLQQGLRYARCMRSQGVSNYPDPSIGPNGALVQGIGSNGIDSNSPTYKAAAQACQKDGPSGFNGGSKSLPVTAQTLKYAQCMRSHGVINFPDGGEISKGSGIDPNSPTFQAASGACQSLVPRPGGS